jgi:hypothetical protein
MTLTMTVAEVKKNLCADIEPGTYKISEILLFNDRPLQIVKGKRRNRP